MDIPSTKQALESLQTFTHHPFDVTLVVGDAVKEFNAHRIVPSQRPARRGFRVACLNFKMTRVGILLMLHVALGNYAKIVCPCRNFS